MVATINDTRVHSSKVHNTGQITVGLDAWGRRCLARTILNQHVHDCINNRINNHVIKLKSLNTDQLMNMVQQVSRSPKTFEALQLAYFAHEGVQRQDQLLGREQPYINHPLRNALRAFLWVSDRWSGEKVELLLQGCLLHDVVEDAPERVLSFCAMDVADFAKPESPTVQTQALHALRDNLGAELASVVGAVTNPLTLNKLSGSEKNEAYRSHLEVSLSGNPVAMLVKASDLWDNAGSAFYGDPEFARRMSTKYLPVIRMIASMARGTDTNQWMGDAVVAERVARAMTALAQKIDVWT